MSRQGLPQPVTVVLLVILFLVGCAGAPVGTPVLEVPTTTAAPASPTVAPTIAAAPVPPTVAPTATARKPGHRGLFDGRLWRCSLGTEVP